MSIELTMIFVAKLYKMLAERILLPSTRLDTPEEQKDEMSYFSPSGTDNLEPCVGIGRM